MNKNQGRALTEKQQTAIKIIQGYSYNSYEVCRILNGYDAQDFIPCFENRRELHDRCRKKTRGCKFRSNSVDAMLRTLWKKGIIKSVKLRWFDYGRTENGICTDLFRFYFLTKGGLAARLKDDIKRKLEND